MRGRRITKKGMAAIAVVCLCLALNVAMALAPGSDEELPTAPQGHASQDAVHEEGGGEIPVPDDLPEGAGPSALVDAVEICLEENGLKERTSLAIVDSGASAQLAVGTPASSWWVYEAVMPDGTRTRFTAGYNSDAGFYASVQ